MSEFDDILGFLRNTFLFKGLPEGNLTQLAAAAQIQALERGEKLYEQGTPATEFFLVLVGRLRLVSSNGKTNFSLGSLMMGDFFGEDCFLGPRRADAAVVLEPTRVIKIPRAEISRLFKTHPNFYRMIDLIARSRQLARRRRFTWFQESEIVYLITRRHPFFTSVAEMLPMIFFMLGILFFIPFAGTEQSWLVTLLGLWIGLSLLGIIWVYLDWENDYFVITSQRLLWVEKIILLYDSRQEALLVNILSTNRTVQPILAKFINYANIFVKTYTGTIALKHTWHPDQLIGLVDGLRSRALDISRQMSHLAKESALRRRLGLPLTEEEAVVSSQSTWKARKKTIFTDLTNFFKMHTEDGSVITYRKHWFILIKKTWLPALVNLAILGVVFVLLRPGVSRILICSVWGLLQLAAGLWWLYHLVDWHNDIYVLSLDNIMDIEKKPLTREEKRVASLDNILSVEHARKGIVGMLLNFGTVTINVGTEKFTFDFVHNPVQVQYEITDRIIARRRRREEEAAAREREGMAEWFEIYHQQSKEIQRRELPPD